MRIAHTVEFYKPHIGGAERVMQRVSEHLAARGHDVTVMTSRHPDLPVTEIVDGVRVLRFDIRGNAVRGIHGRPHDFIDELVGGGYDVILNYACQSWPTDLMFAQLHRIPSAKVLAPCGYSALRSGHLKRRLYRRYFRDLRSILARYDRIVYHSHDYLDHRLGRRWGLSNGEVIPNGVDVHEFDSGATQRRPLVATISNHYRAKGHGDFLRLARKIGGKNARFQLIASPQRGTAWCRARCRVEGAALGIEHFDGADRALVRRKISEARVVVITSHVECSPLVALEAMAAGTPFVSYDVGSVSDLPGGLVVRDFRRLEQCVRRLLEDEALWQKLSSSGRVAARELDWGRIAPRYEALYTGLLRGASRVEQGATL